MSAVSLADVRHRIEYLGLVAIEAAADAPRRSWSLSSPPLGRPAASDVTVFTRDLALLLAAGARLNDALELLMGDGDAGRMRPVIARVRDAILSGESFTDAVARESDLFSPMYVSLARVGEMSGTLDSVLETLGRERVRAEALQRKVSGALQYPAFVLLAALGVLFFFLGFVLPQFSAVLRDFGARTDPVIAAFMALSDGLRDHGNLIGLLAAGCAGAGWLASRRASVRASVFGAVARLPLVSTVIAYHRAAVFSRNLGVLLRSGVTLTAALRILIDIMRASGDAGAWGAMAERVRHGGRLADSLAAAAVLPPVAVRMLRLGEETGQLSVLSERVADFYDEKLQRQLDRIVAVVGPAAIVAISIVVGGLIVSVMTALLSVTQVVG